ncbi:MAG TPA: hypothetical protein VFZ12_04965, partial [Dehalococcoidia bacterium]|nr:hypothetical protein [Dehalococcoidia bacterium]
GELEPVRDFYRKTLGLSGGVGGEVLLGSFTIEVVAGKTDGPTRLAIAADDVSAAERLLSSRGIGASLRNEALWIDPAASCGAQIVLMS